VGEVPLGHQVVGLDSLLDIISMDSDSDSHDHVLGTLSDVSIDSEKVGSLEGLESEAVCERRQRKRTESQLPPKLTSRPGEEQQGGGDSQVVVEIPVEDDSRIELLRVLHDRVVGGLGNHRRSSVVLGVDVGVEILDDMREGLLGLLVKVGD